MPAGLYRFLGTVPALFFLLPLAPTAIVGAWRVGVHRLRRYFSRPFAGDHAGTSCIHSGTAVFCFRG